MSISRLTVKQSAIVEAPIASKQFVHGMAGAGKTTAGVRRLRHLLESGVPGHKILVLVPQMGLAGPYLEEIRSPRRKAGASVTVKTLAGLANNTVDLFWPLILKQLGQSEDDVRRPVFLSLELVQYLMDRLLGDVIRQRDFFNSVRIDSARLYSQILDNLNKSALVGFDADTIAERLKSAALPGAEQRNIYDDAQECARIFREFCVRNNLLDFSLQVSLFVDHLWTEPAPRHYLTTRYTHLIVDNLEEDTPAAHHVLREWVPLCTSALLLYDDEAGYRRFLGADPISGATLSALCDTVTDLADSRVMSPHVSALASDLSAALKNQPVTARKSRAKDPPDPRRAITLPPTDENHYHTQMLDWAAHQAARLIENGEAQASDIVMLAPLLNDAMRFTLENALSAHGIATYSLRPSRPLYDEPATRALLTLARLAHPRWVTTPEEQPREFDVIQAVMTVGQIDLPRARLLVSSVLRGGKLTSFDHIPDDDVRERIGYSLNQTLYEPLRRWIEAYQAQNTPDAIHVFFRRLFGEVLSQPAYAFHGNLDAGRTIESVIKAAEQFSRVLGPLLTDADPNHEFVRMVEKGVIADIIMPDAGRKQPDAVLIAPAYTFLLSNNAVDYQFWLSADSPAWGRRLYQPLTQPYVLSQQWTAGMVWTDAMEQATAQEMLHHVITGLLKRCRKGVFFGYSQYDERGYEHLSDLRVSVDYVLRRLNQTTGAQDE
ncbi:MAG: hypothetical protein KME04_06440 [Pleurocapsa minor GSE-CHR-MK-17-07R]|jgi:hypothetical protein|nr:hypothetical protein [Pleurocapsa minor GSE-CHR-MK 17-07R]